jgi:acetylornithine/succinyldiaminopimelate/putrescine aminotransferase
LSIRSYWSRHTQNMPAPGLERPLEARRCTVQLRTGRLYLDALATPATSLFGHDLPPIVPIDPLRVRRRLSALSPDYISLALRPSFLAANDFAARLGRWAVGGGGQGGVLRINAFEGEPREDYELVIAEENETIARTGSWLSSAAWHRAPELIVLGEALALGDPFGAVLARRDFAARLGSGTFEESSNEIESRFVSTGERQEATETAITRVAATIGFIEREEWLEHGRDLRNYLMARLAALCTNCSGIEKIEGEGLSVRLRLAPPFSATEVCRSLCARGVLTGVDAAGRLAIDPPLATRIAEIDVIIGVLRASILGLPLITTSGGCAYCRQGH